MLDVTSVFHCNRCTSLFEIASEAKPAVRVICPTCGSDVGAYAEFARRRLDRRWVLTRGRPETFEPAAKPIAPRVPMARLIGAGSESEADLATDMDEEDASGPRP